MHISYKSIQAAGHVLQNGKEPQLSSFSQIKENVGQKPIKEKQRKQAMLKFKL